MSPLVILAVLATAFLTGPTAFLFLWLTYVKTGERTIRTIAFSMLGLCFILVCNSASFLLDNYLRIHDQRIAFLLMNGGFLGAVMTSAFFLRFAHEATNTPISSVRRTLFWFLTVLFFFLVISLPIFLVSYGQVDVGHGYVASSIYVTICQIYSTIHIIVRRKNLMDVYRRLLPPLFAVLLALNCVSVLNDYFGFGPALGGPAIPLSPFFFILINVVNIVICVKVLLHVDDLKKGEGALPDFDFTEREREIVPLLVDGLSNDDIAERLYISPHTVKNHVTNIFRKTNVANRFELLKRMSIPG